MILGSAGRLEACRGCRPEIPKNLEVGGRRREVGGQRREVGGGGGTGPALHENEC